MKRLHSEGVWGQSPRRPSGESFVWVTAAGLMLGILMITGLLVLIAVKGGTVFWPKSVMRLELSDQKVLAGIKTEERQATGSHGERELQIFMGNKEVYGLAFRFIPLKQIRRIDYPADLIRLERLEYADAFGFPVSLTLEGKNTIPFSDPGFLKNFERLIREAAARRKVIQKIEKERIGAVNRRLEEAKRNARFQQRQGAWSPAREENFVRLSLELNGAYQKAASEAKALREMQEKDFLNYRLISGELKSVAVGKILRFHFPNRLGLWERLKLFFENVWIFLSTEPREANTEGGVFPAIFGTFLMTVLMSLCVTPFGVLAAIYLREYAKQGFWLRAVRIAVNNLAGVPSIVFGIFGLGFFVYSVGGLIDQTFFRESLPTPTFGTGGILWASLTLALLTVPVVIVAAEEALSAVPRGVREGSLACGASKWQTLQHIVLPAAAPGIMTGLILAMARGASEVAPLMMVGVVKLAPHLPIDGIFPYFHFERKFMHLGFSIYDLGFQSPDSDAARPRVFAITLLLIALVMAMNLGAILIRQHLRKKYTAGFF